MAEKELETLVFCVGPIGGPENPVITKRALYSSNSDYTTKGYARFIEEANNVIKFQYLVLNYFLESVKSEFEEDPLAFIDEETEEGLLAAIKKMKKQWKAMFKEHQKNLRESLQKQKQAHEEASEESSGSAKMPKLDPDATTGAKPEAGMPISKVEFPESIFLRKTKEFATILKNEYKDLRKRMGKALDRIHYGGTVHDLKGFTLQKMEKFAKWKYDLKTLSLLVPHLESKLGELDLEKDKIKENEDRLTKWMYFDDGEKDIKYHHRLLITMKLTVSVAEISALTWRQIQRWKNISNDLASKLPAESEAYQEKMESWRAEVLRYSPKKKLFKPQKSVDSDDTMFGADEMPEEQ